MAAARTLALQLVVFRVVDTEQAIDTAFANIVQQRIAAFVVSGGLNNRRDQIIALAARHAIPAVYANHECVQAGGLRCRRHAAQVNPPCMPADLITLPHFSVSSEMSLPKLAGESVSGMPPKSESRTLILGSARAALISLLSASTIATDVALGAAMPHQLLAS